MTGLYIEEMRVGHMSEWDPPQTNNLVVTLTIINPPDAAVELSPNLGDGRGQAAAA